MRLIESREIRIVRLRDLEIAGEDVEDAAHVGRALNVRVPAQSIYTATGAPDIAKQQLQNRRGANDLRAGGVLRPAHGIDDRSGFLHVAVFADGREQVRGFQKLIFRDTRNALDHFRRVARILLFQQLKDRTRMLQRKIVSDVWREHRRRLLSALSGCTWSTGSLMSLAHRVAALLRSRRLRANRFALTFEILSRLLAGGLTRCC